MDTATITTLCPDCQGEDAVDTTCWCDGTGKASAVVAAAKFVVSCTACAGTGRIDGFDCYACWGGGSTLSLINCTGLEAVLKTAGGDTVVPVSGHVARVATSEEEVNSIGGLPIIRQTRCTVTGLPWPCAGQAFLVDRPVAAALPDRDDLYVPARPIRDADGSIVSWQTLETLYQQDLLVQGNGYGPGA